MSDRTSSSSWRDRAAALVGRTLEGRYRIDSIIATGGMGAVFLGEHVAMQKRVAVKLLRPDVEGFSTLAARFEREAIAGARIDHPNVASATDFGRLEDGARFLVLEYVPGATLHELIKRGPMPAARAAHLAIQIAAGLEGCHAMGVIHRDLKPRNVIVDERRGDLLKIIDLGLARVPLDEADSPIAGDSGDTLPLITLKGIVFGTVAYMAPETALGMDAVDERSDLYALGIIFYQMLSGRHPFDATEPAELFLAQRAILPPPLAVRAPGVAIPPALATVAMRLLAKRPADRYPTARAVIEAIDAAVATSLPLAAETPLTGSYAVRASLAAGRSPLASGWPSASSSSHPRAVMPTPSSTPMNGAIDVRGAGGAGASNPPWEIAPPTSVEHDASIGEPHALPGEDAAAPSDSLAMRLARRRFRPSRRKLWLLVAVAAAAALPLAWPRADGASPVAAPAPRPPTAQAAAPPVEARRFASIANDRASRVLSAGRTSQEASLWRERLLEAHQAHEWRAGATALLALSGLEPASFEDAPVRAASVEVALRQAVAAPAEPRTDEIFRVFAEDLGSHGIDLLYRLLSTRGGSRAADRAAILLQRPEVKARATPALRVTLDLREAGCRGKEDLFARAAAEGDDRAVSYLEQLRSPTCAPASGECCFHASKPLARALKTLRLRE